MVTTTNAPSPSFCPHNGTTHDGAVVCHWSGSPGTRGTLNIFWLCISTLGICVWSAVHPNIPQPGSSWFRKLKARIAWLLVGLFMPEMLVLTALGQLREAIELLVKVEGNDAKIPCEFPWWMNLRKSWKPKNENTKFIEPFWMKALPRRLRPRVPANQTQPEKSTGVPWWKSLLLDSCVPRRRPRAPTHQLPPETPGDPDPNTVPASWWNLLKSFVRRCSSDDSHRDVEKNSPQYHPSPPSLAIGPPPASPVPPPDESGSPLVPPHSEGNGSPQPTPSRLASTPSVQTASAARQHPWTLTHSFYAVMGGFYSSSRRFWDINQANNRSVVIESLQVPLTDPESIPDMTENALADRSKVDGFAKLLLIWQLFVFLANCVARWNQRLPLSLLEITTISHSLCSLVALVIWWYKPHSVGEVTMIGKATAGDPPSWDWSGALYMVLPGSNYIDIPRTITIFAIAALYGLPHLLGRGVSFPSFSEKIFWNIATFAVIGLPMIICLVLWIIQATFRHSSSHYMMLRRVVFVISTMYAVCSMFLVGESLRQVFALPADSFREPQLARYLPSFS